MADPRKSIFRTVKVGDDNFTVVRNDTVQTQKLSWKATGLLVYLLSLPDDWKASISHLSTVKADGRSSTSSAMDELRGKGFVHRFQGRSDSGTFGGFVYLIFNEPVSREKAAGIGFSESGDSETGSSEIGDPPTTKNTFHKTQRGQNTEREGTRTRKGGKAPLEESPPQPGDADSDPGPTKGKEGEGSDQQTPPISEKKAVEIADNEGIPKRVARKWWHYHNSHGWSRSIKNVRSSLVKWNLDEQDFSSNGNGTAEASDWPQVVDEIGGREWTEPQVQSLLRQFDGLERSDFGFARYDERRKQPLYSLNE